MARVDYFQVMQLRKWIRMVVALFTGAVMAFSTGSLVASCASVVRSAASVPPSQPTHVGHEMPDTESDNSEDYHQPSAPHECSLAMACGIAMSASSATESVRAMITAAATDSHISRALEVDLSPEPPPPRFIAL